MDFIKIHEITSKLFQDKNGVIIDQVSKENKIITSP